MKKFLLLCLLLGTAIGVYGQASYTRQHTAWKLASIAQGWLAQSHFAEHSDDPQFFTSQQPIHNPSSLARPRVAPTNAYARLNCAVPNPYRPGTPITCSQLPGEEYYSLELYDDRGLRVFERALSVSRPFTLPAELAAGTYLLKIRANGRPLLSERLVVLPVPGEDE